MTTDRKMAAPMMMMMMLLFSVFSIDFTVYGKQITMENNFSINSMDLARSETRKLVVTTQLQPPYMVLKQHGHFLAGNERFEGFLADILDRLATSIGFEYEIRLSRDFGRQLDGMIDEVEKGLADVAAGPILSPGASIAHSTSIAFTDPFLSFRVSALIRRNQGSSRGQTQTFVSSASQLLTSDFTYGVIQYGPVHRMMNNSTDPVIRALLTRITGFWPPGIVSSVQEGVERARRGHYAFLVDTPTAEYVASRRPCELYASDPFLDVMNYAFVTRRTDEGLRNEVSLELHRMKQTDELQNLYLKWWRDECVGHSIASRRSSLNVGQTRRQDPNRSPPLPSTAACLALRRFCCGRWTLGGQHGREIIAASLVLTLLHLGR